MRSNSADKGRIMQSPERVKRKIQDMAASSEQLKPQINHNEAVKAQLQAKDSILRALIQVCRTGCLRCSIGSDDVRL